MEEIKLKNYTLKYNPENPDDIFSIPDPKTDYKCSKFVTTSGIDYIHKIVMLTKEHPEAHDILKEYLDAFPDKINCQDDEGWTPLHLVKEHLRCSQPDELR